MRFASYGHNFSGRAKQCVYGNQSNIVQISCGRILDSLNIRAFNDFFAKYEVKRMETFVLDISINGKIA